MGERGGRGKWGRIGGTCLHEWRGKMARRQATHLDGGKVDSLRGISEFNLIVSELVCITIGAYNAIQKGQSKGGGSKQAFSIDI